MEICTAVVSARHFGPSTLKASSYCGQWLFDAEIWWKRIHKIWCAETNRFAGHVAYLENMIKLQKSISNKLIPLFFCQSSKLRSSLIVYEYISIYVSQSALSDLFCSPLLQSWKKPDVMVIWLMEEMDFFKDPINHSNSFLYLLLHLKLVTLKHAWRTLRWGQWAGNIQKLHYHFIFSGKLPEMSYSRNVPSVIISISTISDFSW